MSSETNWISKAKEIVEIVYPGNWDFQENEESSFCTLMIFFPEITITNSVDASHVIKEFYVKLQFIKSNGVLYDFAGTRTLLTQAEVQSNYAHSHCGSAASKGDWGGFCLGNGPINSQINRLKLHGVSTENYLVFEMFLIGLQAYLEWESLEGGPYHCMSDIHKRKKIENVDDYVLEDTYKKYINACKFVNFTIIQNKKLEIDPTDEDFMDGITPLIKEEYLVFRDIKGNFYNDGDPKTFKDIKINETFKEQELIRKVIDDESTKKDTRRKYPHPEIAKFIAKKLSRKLTLCAYERGSKTGRQSKSVNIGGLVVQDL
jgi:hypothetical protein